MFKQIFRSVNQFVNAQTIGGLLLALAALVSSHANPTQAESG